MPVKKILIPTRDRTEAATLKAIMIEENLDIS